MTSKYISLFSLEVTHHYYKNGICDDLTYTPSKDTQQLIDRFSFKMMKRPNGFSFYIEEKTSYAEFLNYIQLTTDQTAFYFDAATINSNFYQLTAAYPINQIGTFFYESTDEIKDGNNLLLKKTFNPSTSATDAFTLKIDFTDIVKLKKADNEDVKFNIEFESRSTQWIYNIVIDNNENFDELSIESKSDIVFEGPKAIILQNGQKAMQFSSGSRKIHLKQIPEYTFNLTNTTTKLGNSHKTTVIKGLPNANPETMEIYEDNGTSELASLMYIYV